jgi:DNA-binding CsgD family transcriptional regulator
MGACGKILVVDDDPRFCALIVSIAKEAGYEGGARRDQRRGCAQARPRRASGRRRPRHRAARHLGLRGLPATREGPGAAGIIFVSGTQTGPLDRTAGLLIGADDYIVKPFAPDELLARIRLLIRRTVPDLAPGTNGSRLTPREREVLALLASGAAQAEIADRLVISSRTVAAHIDHILQKLGVHSRAQAVAVAYREGLLDGDGASRRGPP